MPRRPVAAPILLLDGEDRGGPVANLCFPSAVAPDYAPPGQDLALATVLGAAHDPETLEAAVRGQMTAWFGPGVAGWRHLRTERIAWGLPAQPPGALEPPARPVRVAPGIYAAGDHLDDASIDGALRSGRRAAEAVALDLAS